MELQVIQQRIYTIRNQRVMLDFDLAELYEVETKMLKRSVNRNIKRFPSDFLLKLTKEEYDSLRCNFGTLESKGRGRHSKYLPYAFTEQGVAMLSAVLHSEKAIDMNIAIMRAFIALRQVAITHSDIISHLNELRDRLGEHDVQLASIYDTIENLLDKKVTEDEQSEAWKNRNRIGFSKD
jgi:hypothetical protein